MYIILAISVIINVVLVAMYFSLHLKYKFLKGVEKDLSFLEELRDRIDIYFQSLSEEEYQKIFKEIQQSVGKKKHRE